MGVIVKADTLSSDGGGEGSSVSVVVVTAVMAGCGSCGVVPETVGVAVWDAPELGLEVKLGADVGTEVTIPLALVWAPEFTS